MWAEIEWLVSALVEGGRTWPCPRQRRGYALHSMATIHCGAPSGWLTGGRGAGSRGGAGGGGRTGGGGGGTTHCCGSAGPRLWPGLHGKTAVHVAESGKDSLQATLTAPWSTCVREAEAVVSNMLRRQRKRERKDRESMACNQAYRSLRDVDAVGRSLVGVDEPRVRAGLSVVL